MTSRYHGLLELGDKLRLGTRYEAIAAAADVCENIHCSPVPADRGSGGKSGRSP